MFAECLRRTFVVCLPRKLEGNVRRTFVVIAFVPARKALAERSASAFLAGTKAIDEHSSDEHSASAFLGYCLPTVRDPDDPFIRA